MRECSSSPPDAVARRAPGQLACCPAHTGERGNAGDHSGSNCSRPRIQIDICYQLEATEGEPQIDRNAIAPCSELRHTSIFKNHIVIKNATG